MIAGFIRVTYDEPPIEGQHCPTCSCFGRRRTGILSLSLSDDSLSMEGNTLYVRYRSRHYAVENVREIRYEAVNPHEAVNP